MFHMNIAILATHLITIIMGKRLTNLSPVGEVIASELAALQVTVVDFCREAHISRVTYYKLLFGKTS